MIWFYQRGDQHLYYEVRLRGDGPGYALALAAPDGTLVTEYFLCEADLQRRFDDLRAALAREGWGPLERWPRPSSLESGPMAGAGRDTMVC